MKTDKLGSEPKSVLKLSDTDTVSDQLLPEYRFDYSKARPNRFASLTKSPRTDITSGSDTAGLNTADATENRVTPPANVQTLAFDGILDLMLSVNRERYHNDALYKQTVDARIQLLIDLAAND